jgi:adenylate kinase
MRVALTGTPGTGKTTVSKLLPYRIVDINALVKEGLNFGTDPERGCLEADMEGLEKKLDQMGLDSDEIVALEGHMSHYFADDAIVLRLSPLELKVRLKARDYSEKKIMENIEAEALDVILIEALENCSRVHEIDTTGRSPQEVADLVVKIILREIDMLPGDIDWLDQLKDLI